MCKQLHTLLLGLNAARDLAWQGISGCTIPCPSVTVQVDRCQRSRKPVSNFTSFKLLGSLSPMGKQTNKQTKGTSAILTVTQREYLTLTSLQTRSVFQPSFSSLLPSILDDWQHTYYCWLVSIHCKVGITYDKSTVPVIDEWQHFYYSLLVSTDCKVGITCNKNNVPIIVKWQHFCYCELASVDYEVGRKLH